MHGVTEWEVVLPFFVYEEEALVDTFEFVVDADRMRLAIRLPDREPVALDVSEPINVLWMDDGQRVLLWGALDKPDVNRSRERVLLDTPGPGGNRGIPAGLLPSMGSASDDVRWGLWLFGPLAFRPGEVAAHFQVKRRHLDEHTLHRGWDTDRVERLMLPEWAGP